MVDKNKDNNTDQTNTNQQNDGFKLDSDPQHFENFIQGYDGASYTTADSGDNLTLNKGSILAITDGDAKYLITWDQDKDLVLDIPKDAKILFENSTGAIPHIILQPGQQLTFNHPQKFESGYTNPTSRDLFLMAAGNMNLKDAMNANRHPEIYEYHPQEKSLLDKSIDNAGYVITPLYTLATFIPGTIVEKKLVPMVTMAITGNPILGRFTSQYDAVGDIWKDAKQGAFGSMPGHIAENYIQYKFTQKFISPLTAPYEHKFLNALGTGMEKVAGNTIYKNLIGQPVTSLAKGIENFADSKFYDAVRLPKYAGQFLSYTADSRLIDIATTPVKWTGQFINFTSESFVSNNIVTQWTVKPLNFIGRKISGPDFSVKSSMQDLANALEDQQGLKTSLKNWGTSLQEQNYLKNSSQMMGNLGKAGTILKDEAALQAANRAKFHTDKASQLLDKAKGLKDPSIDPDVVKWREQALSKTNLANTDPDKSGKLLKEVDKLTNKANARVEKLTNALESNPTKVEKQSVDLLEKANKQLAKANKLLPEAEHIKPYTVENLKSSAVPSAAEPVNVKVTPSEQMPARSSLNSSPQEFVKTTNTPNPNVGGSGNVSEPAAPLKPTPTTSGSNVQTAPKVNVSVVEQPSTTLPKPQKSNVTNQAPKAKAPAPKQSSAIKVEEHVPANTKNTTTNSYTQSQFVGVTEGFNTLRMSGHAALGAVQVVGTAYMFVDAWNASSESQNKINAATTKEEKKRATVEGTTQSLVDGAVVGTALIGTVGTLAAVAGANFWNPVGWGCGIAALGAGAYYLWNKETIGQGAGKLAGNMIYGNPAHPETKEVSQAKNDAVADYERQKALGTYNVEQTIAGKKAGQEGTKFTYTRNVENIQNLLQITADGKFGAGTALAMANRGMEKEAAKILGINESEIPEMIKNAKAHNQAYFIAHNQKAEFVRTSSEGSKYAITKITGHADFTNDLVYTKVEVTGKGKDIKAHVVEVDPVFESFKKAYADDSMIPGGSKPNQALVTNPFQDKKPAIQEKTVQEMYPFFFQNQDIKVAHTDSKDTKKPKETPSISTAFLETFKSNSKEKNS